MKTKTATKAERREKFLTSCLVAHWMSCKNRFNGHQGVITRRFPKSYRNKAEMKAQKRERQMIRRTAIELAMQA